MEMEMVETSYLAYFLVGVAMCSVHSLHRSPSQNINKNI